MFFSSFPAVFGADGLKNELEILSFVYAQQQFEDALRPGSVSLVCTVHHRLSEVTLKPADDDDFFLVH